MRRRILPFFAILAIATPLRAADVDPWLPNDTEIVVLLNIEQALASPLGRRYLRGALEQALKSNDQVGALLKEVEFDPARDVSRITVAMSSTDSDKSFVIVRGKFRTDKIGESAAKIAADHSDKLKVHRLGDRVMYEMPGDKDATFAAFASDSVLLLSSQRPAIVAALDKSSDKFGKLKPALAQLIGKLDAKQAGWLASLPGPLKKDLPIPQDNPQQKQALDKLQSVTGLLQVGTEVRLHLTMTAADAGSTQQLAGTVDGIIKLLLFLAPGIVKEKPELAPLQDVLATVKSYSKGQSVHVTAELTAKTLEKMIQAIKP